MSNTLWCRYVWFGNWFEEWSWRVWQPTALFNGCSTAELFSWTAASDQNGFIRSDTPLNSIFSIGITKHLLKFYICTWRLKTFFWTSTIYTGYNWSWVTWRLCLVRVTFMFYYFGYYRHISDQRQCSMVSETNSRFIKNWFTTTRLLMLCGR